MDERDASRTSAVARGDRREPSGSPMGLLERSDALELSDAHLTRRSDIPPPAPNGGAWQRSLLEALLAPLDHSRAGAWSTRLLDHFGGCEQALSASPQALERVSGEPRIAALFSAVLNVQRTLLRCKLDERPLLSSFDAVARYLKATLAHQSIERLHVLYLNSANRLLRDETSDVGSPLHVMLQSRLILTRALELGATALILAHNHPSGDPHPSLSDQDATKQLMRAAATLDITLHDHLIFASGGWSSLRALGKL